MIRMLDLKKEYEEQLASLESRMEVLQKQLVGSSGATRYHLKRKIKLYADMIEDCNYSINKMNEYCYGEKPTHSLKLVGNKSSGQNRVA